LEVVSVYPMSSVAMRQLTDAALSDVSVQAAVRGEGQAMFIAHILPHDNGMIGMFADIGAHHMVPGNVRLSRFKYLIAWLLPFLDPHMRTDIMGSDLQEYRIVFSRVDGPKGQPVSEGQLFDLSAKMTPILRRRCQCCLTTGGSHDRSSTQEFLGRRENAHFLRLRRKTGESLPEIRDGSSRIVWQVGVQDGPQDAPNLRARG
jgi:hypothetical protein